MNRSPAKRSFLGILIPGMYYFQQGRVVKGLCWLLACILGYAMLIVPGMIMHVTYLVVAERKMVSTTADSPASEMKRADNSSACDVDGPSAYRVQWIRDVLLTTGTVLVIVLSVRACMFDTSHREASFEYSQIKDIDKQGLDDHGWSASRIRAVIDADVFTVFGSELDEYNTPLKQKQFVESGNAARYREAMQKLKATLLQSDYSVKIGSLDGSTKYNLTGKGFFVTTRERMRKDDSTNQQAIAGFWFPMLEITSLTLVGLTFDEVFLDVSEQEALGIEGKECDVVALFRLTGKNHEHSYSSEFGGTQYEFKESYPVAKDVTIVIVDKNSRETIWRRGY